MRPFQDCEHEEEEACGFRVVKEKERRASVEAFAVPWLKAAWAESVVCADGRLLLLFPVALSRGYFFFLPPPFLPPPFEPPFFEPPFFAPPFFEPPFLVAISCCCSFSVSGYDHKIVYQVFSCGLE